MRELVRHIAGATLLAALTVGLPGCGGGGGGSSTSSTPVPQRRQIASFNFTAAELFDLARGEFTTSATGTLEATCDWTFATNDIDIGIYRGSCSFDQLVNQQCNLLVESVSTTAKPERVSASNVAAGTYTLIVLSIGNTAESGVCQVYLTS
jgi:hypothetical protein